MGERIWFALSSFAVVFLLLVVAVADHDTEWRDLQKEYQRRALAKEKVFSARDLLEDMEIRIRQEYLEGLGRTDRCETCHLGLQNPKMVDAPQPHTTHPGDHLLHHDPQTFGCTVCHGGQGLATNTDDAHGFVPFWNHPIRTPMQIEAACGTCHRDQPLPGAERLNAGRKLFAEIGCVGCHRVGGRGQNIGPDLSALGDKDFTGDARVGTEDWEWNVEHLLRPRASVPTSTMPQFGLSRDEATALTVFLYSLTGSVVPSEYLPSKRPQIEVSTRVEAGRRVYVEYGCAGCHGRNAEGGLLNANAQSGGQVPALEKVKEGYWREALAERINEGLVTARADPAGPPPPLNMPAWAGHIGPEKLELLMDYLYSLAPETEEDDWDD